MMLMILLQISSFTGWSGVLGHRVQSYSRSLENIYILLRCAQLEYPGVYVKLAYYISWILKKTGKSTYCDG